MKKQLLDPRATPLNQNDQHDNKENASNNPDNRSRIHFNSPFGSYSQLQSQRRKPDEGPSILTSRQTQLLHPGAAALDQNDQHNNKENAGNNPDNHSRIHFNSPFFRLLEQRLK